MRRGEMNKLWAEIQGTTGYVTGSGLGSGPGGN
jgi:hypothetical protein